MLGRHTLTPRQAPHTQAAGLFHARNLANIGADITTAARVAAVLHMADAAPHAQNTRDQAARLRDLVASMTGGGAAK